MTNGQLNTKSEILNTKQNHKCKVTKGKYLVVAWLSQATQSAKWPSKIENEKLEAKSQISKAKSQKYKSKVKKEVFGNWSLEIYWKL